MQSKNWAQKILAYDHTNCQFFGRRREACAKCVEFCPHDALHKGDAVIEIEPDLCKECGDCISICPTGAMSERVFNRSSPPALTVRAEGCKILLIDQQNINMEDYSLTSENIVSVPNLGAWSEVEFSEVLMITGADIGVLYSSNEAKSDYIRPWRSAAGLIGKLYKALFGRNPIHLFHDVERALEFLDAPSKISGGGPPACTITHRSLKRETLRDIMEIWFDAAENFEMDEVIENPDYARIICDREKCLVCSACVNQCKAKALILEDQKRKLLHSPIKCMNCGVCEKICPEKALSAEPGLHLNPGFLSMTLLAETEGIPCPECGKLFTSSRRAIRVAEKLDRARGKDPVRNELLSLCPDCRTKKAFHYYSDWTREQ